jgi:hypothetical protein
MSQLEHSAAVQTMEDIFASARTNPSYPVIEKLLALGGTMTQEEGDRFIDDNPELFDLSSLAIQHYNEYILAAEDEQAEQLLSCAKPENFAFEKTANQFGQQAYNRVSDIFGQLDFSNCQRFVMVGCGVLPVTMFQVLDQTGVPEIIGLDVRPEAIQTLESIVEKYDMKRVKPLLMSGDDFDFSGTDIVYVANMVSPKKQVLDRVFETAAPTVQIVMRDPYSIGRLWTERGTDSLDERFEVLGHGKPAPAYFSRDVFVKPNIKA